MLIRPYLPGEEALLRAIFHASVHGIAQRDYTPEQLRAWAPVHYDVALWNQRMRANQALVAELDGQPAAFADLQPSGYIDMFFVAPAYTRRGVGSALLRHIFQAAAARGIGELFSDVSLTAEAFFRHHGFIVETRNEVAVRGEVLANASMRKLLAAPA
ncbi:MAG: GNAT family N-acetyltransferase [Pseudomonadota bacterium]